jgi:hypothetical protein
MSKRVFSTKRRSLLPRTLEALLFLKQSRSLWNWSLVSSIINKPRDTDHEVEEESESDENVYNKFFIKFGVVKEASRISYHEWQQSIGISVGA